MTKYRPRRTRKDANHTQLIQQCRDLGMVVYDTSDIGGKYPDTFICWRGKCLPVEIKAPGKRDELTPGEQNGRKECAYIGVQWVIAEILEDVLYAFGALKLTTNEQRLARHLREVK